MAKTNKDIENNINSTEEEQAPSLRAVAINMVRNLIYRADKITNNNFKAIDTDLTTIATTVSNLVPNGTAGNIYTASGTPNTPIQVSATPLSSLAPIASPNFTGNVSVPTPTVSNSAVNKSYVDNAISAVIQGISNQMSVRAATSGPITLSGLQTIDGVSLVAGNRVLVLVQGGSAGGSLTLNAANGVYIAAAGAWSFASDYIDASGNPTGPEPGWAFYVSEGTAWGNAQLAMMANTVSPIIPGTTPVQFTQINGLGDVTVSTGLTKAGNTLSANIGAGAGQLAEGNKTINIVAAIPGDLVISGSPLTIGTGGTMVLNMGNNMTKQGNNINVPSALVKLDSSGNFTQTADNLAEGATNKYYTTTKGQTDAAVLNAPIFVTATTALNATQNKAFFTVSAAANATIIRPTVNRDIYISNSHLSTANVSVVDSISGPVDLGDGTGTNVLNPGDSRWLAFNVATNTYNPHS